MKITIATGPIFPVPAVRGGAVQRLWEGLAREFVKRGHEVTIFAREFPGQAGEEVVDGVRYVRRGGYEQSTSIKRDLVQCLLYTLKTARQVPAGNVVVTNDFWMPAVLPWLNRSVGMVVASIARFPKGQFFLYKKCAALAAVSKAVADAVKAQSPSVAGKVAVVPNAIDEVFLEETKRARDEGTKGPRDQGIKRLQDYGTTERQDGSEAVRILYVGRIHPEKGLGLLAGALRLLAAKDQEPESAEADGDSARQSRGQTKNQKTAWECVLVGPVKESEGGGGEAFAGELKRQMEGLPVRFEPPVFDPASLVEIYDQADIFVYPSIADAGESFGIAPLEAMARGVVPAVSDLAAFREYLEPGVNGLVFDHRSKDAEANLALILGELVGHAKARKRLGREARATAERFSISAIADKYLQLFARLV